MTTYSFYSFRFLKISSYIIFLIFFGRILAPPPGGARGQMPPPPAPPLPPLATPLNRNMICLFRQMPFSLYLVDVKVYLILALFGFIKNTIYYRCQNLSIRTIEHSWHMMRINTRTVGLSFNTSKILRTLYVSY